MPPERPALAVYAFQSPACCLLIQVENCAVVPEPSERTTGTTLRAGSVMPGLSFLIAGSFQVLMTPVKILVTFSPDRRRFVICLLPTLRLYMNDVPPATIGMYAYERPGGVSVTPPSVRP